MNPKEITHTEGFNPDVSWEPFIDGPMAGMVCHMPNGKKHYIYLNPSTSGEGEPDVFLYSGATRDPSRDDALCFVVPEE